MSGWINAQVTKLADSPEKLAEFMADKTEQEKRAVRAHLRTVKALKAKAALSILETAEQRGG